MNVALEVRTLGWDECEGLRLSRLWHRTLILLTADVAVLIAIFQGDKVQEVEV